MASAPGPHHQEDTEGIGMQPVPWSGTAHHCPAASFLVYTRGIHVSQKTLDFP